MRRTAFLTFALCLLSQRSFAAPLDSASASMAGLSNSKEPTYIKSDTLSLDSKQRVFEYKGNVEVINGELTMLADRLQGHYSEKNDITDITAFDNVKISKGDAVKANGEKAVYSAGEQTVVLTENPEMVKDGSVLSADKITIYLKEDRSEAEGRVRVKLLEDDKDKNKDKAFGKDKARDKGADKRLKIGKK